MLGGVVGRVCISLFHYGRSGMRAFKFGAHVRYSVVLVAEPFSACAMVVSPSGLGGVVVVPCKIARGA
jgi:hypothetical protein